MASTSARRSGTALTLAIAGAVFSSALIWQIFAWPVLSGAAAGVHHGHYASVYAHAVGGTAMLFLGAAALYVGFSRRAFRHHRWIGRAYLAGGALGAGMGLYLSVVDPHPLPGVPVATGTLALAWLGAAAMAWRAALNRRFDSHRDWMVRSYVLTWTFVFCRMVMRSPLGAGADPTTVAAIIWASWIGPVLVCEAALQWRAGAPLKTP